jgi:RNA polymerase sigma-70 factor (ECF subfamily)
MLRLLIRRSWLLLLLLIAIPTALWKLMQNEEKTKEKPEADHMPTPTPHHRETAVESLRERPVYAAVGKLTAAPQPISYQAEAVIEPDSIPSFQIEEQPLDTIGHQHERLAPQPSPTEMQETQQFMPSKPKKPEWNITLAYNGQLGRRDDYLAVATISKGSFDATSNSFIPAGQAFSNWKDYSYYLSNSPQGLMDAETRSLMNIAAQNSTINDGAMEARHEHQLPLTVQLLLSRQLSARLSLETGLSYTLLSSTVHTGSVASVLERQRIHYLGIPLRASYTWMSHKRLSAYSSAGVTMHIPVYGKVKSNYVVNWQDTYSESRHFTPSLQWQTGVSLGLQYKFAPNANLFVEPTFNWFIPSGNDTHTTWTEHPFMFTCPFGIRITW